MVPRMAETEGIHPSQQVPTFDSAHPAIVAMRQALVYLAALALALLILVTVIDVAGRYLLNTPLPGAFESVRALMALITFSALPLVCARNEHLRAGILDHLISPRMNRLREPAVQLISVAVLVVICWRLVQEASNKQRTGELLSAINLPLWMPIGFMALMSVAAVIVTSTLAWLTLRQAMQPDRIP